MGCDRDERMREVHRHWDRQDARREWRRRQIEHEIRQTRRQIDLDRLDAQLYPQDDIGPLPSPSAPANFLALSEISEYPQPGYTHANLQEAIRDARSLMSSVAYGPHFNFMTAHRKQEMMVRLQIAELKARLSRLRLDLIDHDRLILINDLERQLRMREESLRNLSDPPHPIHHAWKSKK